MCCGEQDWRLLAVAVIDPKAFKVRAWVHSDEEGLLTRDGLDHKVEGCFLVMVTNNQINQVHF